MRTLTLLAATALALTAGRLGWLALRDSAEAEASASALATLASRRAALAADLPRAEARLAAATAERTRAESALAPLSAPKPAPPASTPPRARDSASTALRKDPALQSLSLTAERARLAAQYGPLFRQFGLSAAQIAQFQTNVIHRKEQDADLEAAIESKNLDENEEAVMRLRGITEDEYTAAQRQLLGDDGVKQLKEYEVTQPARDAVRGLAATAVSMGLPLTPQQAGQLTQAIIAQADRPDPGAWATPESVDWDRVEAQAQLILTAPQLALFRTVEPHLETSHGSVFDGRMMRLITAAREADLAATKPPGP
jgi:hypothetical protein